jgi:hypothetical protein
MATKRKLEDEIEGAWTPDAEKPPTKKLKRQESKRQRAEKKFLKSFTDAVDASVGLDHVRLRVVKKIRKSKYPWLERDIEVGETWIAASNPSNRPAHDGLTAVDAKQVRDIHDIADIPCIELPIPNLNMELSVPLVKVANKLCVVAWPTAAV